MKNVIMDDININPAVIEDRNLSFKALGIYIYLKKVEKEKGRITTKDFREAKADGVTAITSGLKELIENGYIARNQVRKNGKLMEYEYFILDKYSENNFDDFFAEFEQEVADHNIDIDYNNDNKYKYVDDDIPEGFDKYTELWEENVGLLSSAVGKWLLKIANKIEYEVFEEAVHEAVAKGVQRHDYIKKILDNWIAEGITNMEELNQSRLDRNSKFEEATLKRVEKTSNKASNSFNNISTKTHINKASKIQPRQDIIELFADKKKDNREENVDGQHGQNFEENTDITNELERIRAKRRGEMRPM